MKKAKKHIYLLIIQMDAEQNCRMPWNLETFACHLIHYRRKVRFILKRILKLLEIGINKQFLF